MTKCTNCGEQSPAQWQEDGVIVDGLVISRADIGYYSGFMDSMDSNEYAHLCHDCSLLLMRTLTGLAEFLLPNRCGHPQKEVCCEYAWKSEGQDIYRGTVNGEWEKVVITPNKPYDDNMNNHLEQAVASLKALKEQLENNDSAMSIEINNVLSTLDYIEKKL